MTPSNKEILKWSSVQALIHALKIVILQRMMPNKINASGIHPHQLALKPGACIILIKNLNIEHGHCNDTHKRVNSNSHQSRKSKWWSPFGDFDTSNSNDFTGQGTIRAVAIPRPPGILPYTKWIYLPKSVFFHWHLYVGCSRCGDPNNMFVDADQSELNKVKEHLTPGEYCTRNIVYPEIFST